MARLWAGTLDRDAFAVSSPHAQFGIEHDALVVSPENRLP